MKQGAYDPLIGQRDKDYRHHRRTEFSKISSQNKNTSSFASDGECNIGA